MWLVNDRGVTGEVLKVYPKDDRVLVAGVNVRTKHLKPTQANPRGGTLKREMPIHISNVSPVIDGRPTRVRFEVQDDGDGFDPAVVERGAGLDGMADRLDTVGGRISIDSTPGEGTTVSGAVPVEALVGA